MPTLIAEIGVGLQPPEVGEHVLEAQPGFLWAGLKLGGNRVDTPGDLGRGKRRT
jgi:hypothetical protein